MFRDALLKRNYQASLFSSFKNQELCEKGSLNDNDLLVIRKIDINLRDKGQSKERSLETKSKRNNLLLTSVKNRIINEYDNPIYSVNEKNSLILPIIKNINGENTLFTSPRNINDIKIIEKSIEKKLKISNEKKTLLKSTIILDRNSKNNKPLESVDQLKQLQTEKKAMFQASKEKVYYFIVIPGNNSELIKKCLSYRSSWKECSNQSATLYNFKWQQSCYGIDFNIQNKLTTIKQSFNHFEFHNQISNKLNLFINLMKYCEHKNINIFKFFPLTIPVYYDSQQYINFTENFPKLFLNIDDFIYSNIDFNRIKQNIPSIKNNKHSSTSKKEAVYYNNLFRFQPPFDKVGSKTIINIPQTHFNKKNYWLVKAPNLNRGRCIKISDNIPKIHKILKKFNDGIMREFKEAEEEENLLNNKLTAKIEESNTKENNEEEGKNTFEQIINLNTGKKYKTSIMLLQKYIESPLLYNKRKFDIRMWVLVTHNMEVYCFKEGHLKTTSIPYNVNLIDPYIHLTNYSVQKYNENFSKFEYGNEVSFKEFQNFIDKYYPNMNINVRDNIYTKIKEIIKLSLKAVKDKLNPNQRKFNFEIFGYDFILDSEFEVYLLEINTNPGLEESSPLISQLVPRMIDDALRLTLDEMFPTEFSPVEYINKSPFHVDEYDPSENLWESLCSLKIKEKVKKIKVEKKAKRLKKKKKKKNDNLIK